MRYRGRKAWRNSFRRFSQRESSPILTDGGAFPSKKDRITAERNETDWREYPLSELKDFRLEELLSGARLTAKTRGGEYVFLTAMSNYCKNSVLLFIKYLNKLQRGEIAEIEVYWN